MASLEDLEQREREIDLAERDAVRGLAGYLRAAIRDLPSESRLPRMFFRHAKDFDMWAGGSGVADWTNSSLRLLQRDLKREDEGGRS